MIRISQLKMSPGYNRKDIQKKIQQLLGVSAEQIQSFVIARESLDARKKPDVFFSLIVDVAVDGEERILKRNNSRDIIPYSPETYSFPKSGNTPLKGQPVIIGAGPAGLFCAYYLAKNGYCPVIFERGKTVDERKKDIEEFWETGKLNLSSNVQFGEGGAGTFSDGKLNTLIKDKSHRNREILELFCQMGASEEILYQQKPHLGTDKLISIVRNLREEIIRLGGTFYFNTTVTKLLMTTKGNSRLVSGVQLSDGSIWNTDLVVLAIGHSARDTITTLYQDEIPMESKAFAIGFRVEHPQEMIQKSQYGTPTNPKLPVADYKLTATTADGRGVYSFCMCPGGYVVNSSSEENALAVNGMSYSDRGGPNANSAIIVSVTPEDFPDSSPLGGIAFQRSIEKRAYEVADGCVPVQLFGDFQKNRVSDKLGEIHPCIKGSYALSNVRAILPEYLNEAFIEGMKQFDRKIKGFAGADTLVIGVESRTSSPVRILRNDSLESEIQGLYPCGEGAGYAGGITSAAVDGLKVAEAVATKFLKWN